MSDHHKKTNHKKSSSSSSSSHSSENNLWQNIEQPSCKISRSSTSSSSRSSIKRPIYPNVPKRSQRSSCIHDHDTIQTESRIDIIPSEKDSQKSNEYSSIESSSNQNTYIRHTLDLITKYTSPKKKLHESNDCSLSPIQNQINISSNNQSIYGSKCKRTLSPLDEKNQQNYESKRTKSYGEIDDDDDGDDKELSQFLDHRYNKQISSENNNTTNSSQPTTNDEQRKPTVRKPTVRNLGGKQQKPTLSQPIPTEQPTEPHEALIIEVDHDTEEETMISREAAKWLSRRSQFSNMHQNESDSTNQSISTPTIPFLIKLPIENCLDSSNSNNQQDILSTPIRSSRQTRENLIDDSSPCSNNGRRLSTTSSNSLIFSTPNSSFSRIIMNNTTSTPRNLNKNDRETQLIYPSNIDMINQLISQMNLNINKNEIKIDYNPKEIAKKFFYQYISISNHTYQRINLLIKKQFLHFGRYEIEVLFPINHEKNPTIYACDICLKHFHGSLTAYQRHTAKCLYTQPPGKLVFNKDDLAIFEIGQTIMNMEQHIYIQSLYRIVRLFIDSNKNINERKIDRFTYYILCRRDPILSQFQSSIYHFVGYFSKQLHQQTLQLINNLSYLFILPCYIQQQQYSQCLIAYSYFLIRSNVSTNQMYSSPVRPLDNITLVAFRNYWRDILFSYIINHNHSSIKPLPLNIFARQTSIHPRDILSSLYSNDFIVPHPTDKSSVYLLHNAYRSMTSLNLHTRNKFLLIDMNLINTNDDKKIIHDKPNIDKSRDSGIEEIVLD